MIQHGHVINLTRLKYPGSMLSYNRRRRPKKKPTIEVERKRLNTSHHHLPMRVMLAFNRVPVIFNTD